MPQVFRLGIRFFKPYHQYCPSRIFFHYLFPCLKAWATRDAAVEVIKKAGYVDDFMHGTSHFLGLDVHDAGDRATVLKPGMVITVEPGIYLAEQGFGIRIEDDVLVTERGYEILSKNIPRKRDEVESWIARTRK